MTRSKYGDDERELGDLGFFWFGFVILVQRLCIGVFFFFLINIVLVLVCFAFALYRLYQCIRIWFSLLSLLAT